MKLIGIIYEAGYVILRNCLSTQQLRDARNSIEKELGTVTKSSTDVFFLAAIKNSDWPEECKRLSVEIRVMCKDNWCERICTELKAENYSLHLLPPWQPFH
jgi:hypothetical protein